MIFNFFEKINLNFLSGEQCEANDFKCLDGQCIFSILRCDGSKDCNDGSDEANCSKLFRKLSINTSYYFPKLTFIHKYYKKL